MKKKISISIDKEKCKGCMFCVEVCPKKILIRSTEVNEKGLQFVVVEDPDNCTGCGLCALMCPDCAIELIKE